MVESPLAAVLIILQGANEAPVEKDCVLHFRLLAIGVCRYPNVYKAWQNHLHQNTNIYNDLSSIQQIGI